MPVAALPPNIQNKLDGLSRRLHRLRLLRGVSWVVLTFVMGAALALGLDAALELRPAARCIIAGTWITTVVLVAWRELIQPLRRAVTAPGLAAAVEEEYPRLGERLTSTVELADADATHGSPAFVRLLMRETEQKTRALDFCRAAPPHASEWLTAASVAAVLVLAAPLVFIPEYYLGLGRRLLLPWDSRPAVMPYVIEVTPGDAFAARGRPLTIGVTFQPTRPEAALPVACTLLLTGTDGKPNRLHMPAASTAHAFAFRIDELQGNLHYYIETGNIETATHAIIAVDPVGLVGGPTTKLTPPVYAKTAVIQTVVGPNDLSILQYGRIAIDCRVDRPAEAITLIVTPASGTDRTPQRRLLALAEDRQSGRIELPARNGATLQLELAAAHDITTVTPEQMLTVTPDQPPQFRRAAGLPERGSIRPDDALALDLIVTDDLAVSAVEVEYQVNGGPVHREPITLAGIGSPGAAGRAEFKVAGKAKDGDTLRIRLRAADNRDVPEAKVGPNVTTYPAGERWSELRVSADAPSVRQQDVTAHRDDIDKRLRDLIARVDKAAKRTSDLSQRIEQDRISAEDSSQAVGELTGEQTDLSKKLEDLAADAALAGLQPLADALRAVGSREFQQTAEALRDAGMAIHKSRVVPLHRADAALTDAQKKLEALLQENRALADARLAEVMLQELAEHEQQLADQTKQAVSPEERDRLAKEQQQIAEALAKLLENDPSLREALQASRSEDARQLAEQSRKLAQAERDLDAKLAAAQKLRNAAKLAELAQQQEQLATDVDRLAKQTQNAAKAIPTAPLDAQAATKAAADLRSGDAEDALEKQDQSARELERIAEKLQRAVEAAKDPRAAAKQLARLQEENRKRLDRPAEATLARQQQEAIGRAVDKLNVPNDNTAARRDRQQAAELATEAGRVLNRGDTATAEFRMGQAKDALDRLANDLPAPGPRPAEAARPQPSAEQPDGIPDAAQVAQARALARRQRDLRDRVAQLTNADSANPEERDATNKQQKDLATKAGAIGQSLDASAGTMPNDQAQQGARAAAASARHGEKSMRQSQGNDPSQAKQARKQAAEALDRAAAQAEQAAQSGSEGKAPKGSPKTGQQLQRAQGQMGQAEKQLGDGQSQAAGSSMQTASDALRDAAKDLGQGGPRQGATQPATMATQGKGVPTAGKLPEDLQKYAGKKWGELPGELRTRIVQDMKAQYGDDYGRIIKLYFEQIAENNGKK